MTMNEQQNQALISADNTQDAWRRLTLEPLQAGDRSYYDCSEARGTNVARKLKRLLDLHRMDDNCMHLLLTGYRGDGKTTELFQFMNAIQHQYCPFYFNAEQEFDLLDFRFPDFLLGIATAIFEWMSERNLALKPELIEDIANWFTKIVQTVERKTEGDIKAEAGVGVPNLFKFVTAKLTATIKAGGVRREEIRRELNQNLAQLIDKVNRLLSEAVKVSKASDQREIVIVVDSMDRLHHDLAFDLFHTHGQNLCGLDCHFIYVVPISLLYRPEATRIPFANQLIMPMIPVRNREGEPNETNIAHLRRLLEQRFVPDKIMTDSEAIMRSLILSSGGHLRDLVRLFRTACSEAMDAPDEKINPKIAKWTINQLCETYQRAVEADDYAPLIKTYHNKEAEINERTQRLIFNTVILVYETETGVTWRDVHPVLANGEKFQELLK
jgi:hypothetical protein